MFESKQYQTPIFTWKLVNFHQIPYINVAKINFTISKLRNATIEHLIPKSTSFDYKNRNMQILICVCNIDTCKKFECKMLPARQKERQQILNHLSYYPVRAFRPSLQFAHKIQPIILLAKSCFPSILIDPESTGFSTNE